MNTQTHTSRPGVRSHLHTCIGTLLTLALGQATAATCFVSTDGAGSGSSWADTTTLTNALAEPTCDSIWVQQGTYYPTTDNDRTVSFVIDRELTLYGGFAGTETQLSERDIDANPTILSGDIGTQGNPADNSYHVLFMDAVVAGSFNTANSTIDGFHIVDGQATGTGTEQEGAGLYCNAHTTNAHCAPALRNLIFANHRSSAYGGAINDLAGDPNNIPIMKNVAFINNTGVFGGAVYISPEIDDRTFIMEDVTFAGNNGTRGGALYAKPKSNNNIFRLNNVDFINNSGSSKGGAIYFEVFNLNSNSLNLERVNFIGNDATEGGAMETSTYNEFSTSNIEFNEVNFISNTSGIDGAAINIISRSKASSNFTLTRVSFIDNHAEHDGGAINTRTFSEANLQFDIQDSTFSGNTAENQGGVLWDGSTSGGINSYQFTNVTMHQNAALDLGGAIYHHGSNPNFGSHFEHVIMSGNQAAGGVNIYSNAITSLINNSLIEGDCPVNSTCNNVIDAAGMLGQPGYLGGFTQTVPLQADSPAIDAGDHLICSSSDQRGIPRPIDGDGDGVSECDFGAFEFVDLIFADDFEE